MARFGSYDVDWALRVAPSERPTASEVWHGAIMIESGQNTGEDDSPVACIRLANGDYAWVPLATPDAAEVTAEIAAAVVTHNAAAHDPLTTIDIIEDFLTGGITTGIIGQTGMAFNAAIITTRAAEANHPGIIRVDSSATPSTVAAVYGRVGGSTATILPASTFDLTYVFRLNTNDADTRIRLGLANTWIDAAPTDGIYLEKTLADTEWFGVCRASSTETPRTAALATVDTSWHKVRIRRVDAATIGFTFDAETEVPLTTNIPTAGTQFGMHIFTNAAAAKTIDLDYIRVTVSGLVR